MTQIRLFWIILFLSFVGTSQQQKEVTLSRKLNDTRQMITKEINCASGAYNQVINITGVSYSSPVHIYKGIHQDCKNRPQCTLVDFPDMEIKYECDQGYTSGIIFTKTKRIRGKGELKCTSGKIKIIHINLIQNGVDGANIIWDAMKNCTETINKEKCNFTLMTNQLPPGFNFTVLYQCEPSWTSHLPASTNDDLTTAAETKASEKPTITTTGTVSESPSTELLVTTDTSSIDKTSTSASKDAASHYTTGAKTIQTTTQTTTQTVTTTTIRSSTEEPITQPPALASKTERQHSTSQAASSDIPTTSVFDSDEDTESQTEANDISKDNFSIIWKVVLIGAIIVSLTGVSITLCKRKKNIKKMTIMRRHTSVAISELSFGALPFEVWMSNQEELEVNKTNLTSTFQDPSTEDQPELGQVHHGVTATHESDMSTYENMVVIHKQSRVSFNVDKKFSQTDGNRFAASSHVGAGVAPETSVIYANVADIKQFGHTKNQEFRRACDSASLEEVEYTNSEMLSTKGIRKGKCQNTAIHTKVKIENKGGNKGDNGIKHQDQIQSNAGASVNSTKTPATKKEANQMPDPKDGIAEESDMPNNVNARETSNDKTQNHEKFASYENTFFESLGPSEKGETDQKQHKKKHYVNLSHAYNNMDSEHLEEMDPTNRVDYEVVLIENDIYNKGE